mmetsp:Transcript_4379/g.16558  ORF Transcript_4379/g.16558 Transcript_4379/m.16558 type:complete len:206 (+) Transcript_4379:428-1045(+)
MCAMSWCTKSIDLPNGFAAWHKLWMTWPSLAVSTSVAPASLFLLLRLSLPILMPFSCPSSKSSLVLSSSAFAASCSFFFSASRLLTSLPWTPPSSCFMLPKPGRWSAGASKQSSSSSFCLPSPKMIGAATGAAAVASEVSLTFEVTFGGRLPAVLGLSGRRWASSAAVSPSAAALAAVSSGPPCAGGRMPCAAEPGADGTPPPSG